MLNVSVILSVKVPEKIELVIQEIFCACSLSVFLMNVAHNLTFWTVLDIWYRVGCICGPAVAGGF